jgi:hypothetical protein
VGVVVIRGKHPSSGGLESKPDVQYQSYSYAHRNRYWTPKTTPSSHPLYSSTQVKADNQVFSEGLHAIAQSDPLLPGDLINYFPTTF